VRPYASLRRNGLHYLEGVASNILGQISGPPARDLARHFAIGRMVPGPIRPSGQCSFVQGCRYGLGTRGLVHALGFVGRLATLSDRDRHAWAVARLRRPVCRLAVLPSALEEAVLADPYGAQVPQRRSAEAASFTRDRRDRIHRRGATARRTAAVPSCGACLPPSSPYTLEPPRAARPSRAVTRRRPEGDGGGHPTKIV
jgi:hypothetical protein